MWWAQFKARLAVADAKEVSEELCTSHWGVCMCRLFSNPALCPVLCENWASISSLSLSFLISNMQIVIAWLYHMALQ